MWRLRRIPIIEAQVMSHKLARRDTNPAPMAYLRDGGPLEFLHLSRYEANLDRCLHKTLKDLQEARETNAQNKANDQVANGESLIAHRGYPPADNEEPNHMDEVLSQPLFNRDSHTSR